MPGSARDLMTEALDLLRGGHAQEGIETLQRTIAAQPDLIEAWGHLAAQMIAARRHEEAIACYEQVLRVEPHNVEARWRIGDRLLRLGRLDEAEARYRSARDDDPACHDARCGVTYVEWLRKNVGQVGNLPDEATSPAQAVAPPPDDEAIRERRDENLTRAREHFQRGDARLTSLPTHLHIETTTRCNAACITCVKAYVSYEAEDLRPEVFERIERDLLPAMHYVNLTGLGEPLLGRGFDRFFDEAVRQGTRVQLVTNATALSMARLERFARRPTDLAASIDGATRDTFESIRRGSRFDGVIETLRLYKKMRDVYLEAGSKLWINFVALRRNIEELPALVDLAAELGAELIVVIDFATGAAPPDVAAEHLSRYPELANRMFDEAAECARRHGIVLQLPPKYPPAAAPGEAASADRIRAMNRLLPERHRFPQRCPDPWMAAYITAGGLVYPCCGSRRAMGDLNRQAFAEIWNGPRYRRFRRRIRSFLPPLECRRCTLFWGINAGNPGVVQGREGMLVKLLYAAEESARRFVRRFLNPWRRMA